MVAPFDTTVVAFVIAYAVLLVAGAGLLLAAATGAVRSQRQVRLARHQSVPAYYLGLARSH